MDNPWLKLPESKNYVLKEDEALILEFNQKISPASDVFVHLDLLPEPFIGNLVAPIVLLGLNPGYSPQDNHVHQDADFIELSRANLQGVYQENAFFMLNSRINAPGQKWWEQKLGKLITATSRETVAGNILCVEYFPYHTRRFAHSGLRVPSQDFSFEVVRQAIEREAVIIILRSHKLWRQVIPQLATYTNIFQIKNPQNVTISRNNCPDGWFDKVVEVLIARQSGIVG